MPKRLHYRLDHSRQRETLAIVLIVLLIFLVTLARFARSIQWSWR